MSRAGKLELPQSTRPKMEWEISRVSRVPSLRSSADAPPCRRTPPSSAPPLPAGLPAPAHLRDQLCGLSYCVIKVQPWLRSQELHDLLPPASW